MKQLFLLAAVCALAGSALRADEPAGVAVPAALEALQAKIGGHWAFKGTVLSFRAEQPLTEDQWKAIEGLGVKLIATGGKGIDDAAVARLAHLDPQALLLDGAELTDDGCRYLAQMKSLRVLWLGHNAFNNPAFAGSGLAQLKHLPKFESLSFAGASTGETAMAAVGEVTRLTEFATWHTKQTDPRNLHLLNLTALKSLTLGNCLSQYDGQPRRLSLTDATLDTLAQLKSLENLTLMECRLTWPALEKLQGLPGLKTIQLQQVDVRPDDVEKLRIALPQVNIQWTPLTDAERKRLIESCFTFTNNLGMNFVWIPAGSFLMGSPAAEKERKNDEAQHPVRLTKGFYLGVDPVTQEQWQQIMDTNPSKFQGDKNLPVEQVSWQECQDFIHKLGEKDPRPYRLPTEAEWEYACRAGTSTPFYWGETLSTDQANYNGNYIYGAGSQGIYREKTVPVDSFPANGWGLRGMHGNVWQWCQDWFDEYPKMEAEAIDPLGLKGDSRVIRGGSWIDNPLECRSAYRGGSKPALRHSLVGFRICFNID